MNSLRLLSRNVQQVSRVNAAASARFFQSSSTAFTGKTHNATDKTFASLIDTKEPVVVDFHADWCGPCKMLDPVIREAVEASGAVTLIRVDVDSCGDTAAQFQISSIPCVMAFKDGKVVDKFVGMLPRPTIKAFIDTHAKRA